MRCLAFRCVALGCVPVVMRLRHAPAVMFCLFKMFLQADDWFKNRLGKYWKDNGVQS